MPLPEPFFARIDPASIQIVLAVTRKSHSSATGSIDRDHDDPIYAETKGGNEKKATLFSDLAGCVEACRGTKRNTSFYHVHRITCWKVFARMEQSGSKDGNGCTSIRPNGRRCTSLLDKPGIDSIVKIAVNVEYRAPGYAAPRCCGAN
jgi:hypothetical protein